MKPSIVIVTGGAGFIGSQMVKELNDKGKENIIIVDRLESSIKWKNLRPLKYLDYFHADDFIQNEFLNAIAEGHTIEAIYHMGACSSTTEMDMDYLYENNVKYSQKLWDFCTHYQIPFCYASSAATYGDGEKGYQDDSIEGLIPLNPYGFSKQLFDVWVQKQEKTPPFWFGLKFFNVYGPMEYHKEKMRSVVVQAFEQIEANKKMKLFKSYREGIQDGEQKRDFVYVKDLTKAMYLMTLERKNYPMLSGIYNMGTGEARTFKDLALASFEAMGVTPNIEYIEMPDHLKNQYQYFTQASMTRFEEVFGKGFFRSLEDGVQDYYQDHLQWD